MVFVLFPPFTMLHNLQLGASVIAPPPDGVHLHLASHVLGR